MMTTSGKMMNQTNLILKVCKQVAPQYKFGYYGDEDMIQEAFIMAMKALPHFDSSKASLSTFLTAHLHNKLRTFKRDHYIRKDFTCKYCNREDPNCEHCQRKEWRHAAKKYIMEPIDIDNVNTNSEKNMRAHNDVLADVELHELTNIINNNLSIELRSDYIKILHGVYVPRKRRMIIESEIIRILEQNGYYDD